MRKELFKIRKRKKDEEEEEEKKKGKIKRGVGKRLGHIKLPNE